jgi:hypothetical protein
VGSGNSDPTFSGKYGPLRGSDNLPSRTIAEDSRRRGANEDDRIVAARYTSEHDRVPECGRDSIHPEHRTARLAKVAGAHGRLYLQRQELLDRGPVAEVFLTEIVHRCQRAPKSPHFWASKLPHPR